jgi:poly[(R)-3-hydroxyalkanoate] polymerase subunit PhaC
MLFLTPKRLHRGRKLARLAADRALLRFVNGMSLLLDGSATPMGNTPRDTILSSGKLEVWRYRPLEEDPDAEESVPTARFPVPILLIPPLMVRPYIYDLRPEHSLVRFLRAAGFDVYLVDFGVPDDADRDVRLDDYVLDWVPRAVEAVRKSQGAPDVTLAGWCMGGIFALLHTAAWHDAQVRNIVTIASPIDFAKMGLLSTMARAANGQIQDLTDRIGNIPGFLNANALKLLAPVKQVTRYADLFINLWNEEYVKGYDAMSTWSNDFIAYPQQAFKQMVNDVVVGNGLLEGISFKGRPADLADVRCNLLAFAGSEDVIATPASARAIVSATRPRDQQYHEVPGGHIGVVVGGRAPKTVWGPTVEWLKPRSLGANP